MTRPMPGTKSPELEVRTVFGEIWTLSKQSPERFTLIVFYRGLHCPICQTYLMDLEAQLKRFFERGVEVIAVSGDTEERATESKKDWGLKNLKIGYAQHIESMRQWGLYVSNSIKDSEPAQFGEPGLFLVRPNRKLYYVAINSMPFGRPHFKDLISTVDWVTENDYPARGEA